jgi:hypothetical protein
MLVSIPQRAAFAFSCSIKTCGLKNDLYQDMPSGMSQTPTFHPL